MEMSPSRYDPPFLSCAHISIKNGAQNLQKWCPLNFDDELEFKDLVNIPK